MAVLKFFMQFGKKDKKSNISKTVKLILQDTRILPTKGLPTYNRVNSLSSNLNVFFWYLVYVQSWVMRVNG